MTHLTTIKYSYNPPTSKPVKISNESDSTVVAANNSCQFKKCIYDSLTSQFRWRCRAHTLWVCQTPVFGCLVHRRTFDWTCHKISKFLWPSFRLYCPAYTDCVLLEFEPAHEIMAFFVLRKLILQTRMRSHPVGLDVWFLVGPFVHFHTSCVRTAKALARLRGCAGSPEPSLVAYVISTIISWAGSVCFIWLRFHALISWQIVDCLPWKMQLNIDRNREKMSKLKVISLKSL